MTEVERALEQVVASLSDDPAVGRLLGAPPAVLLWRSDGEDLLWSSPGIDPIPPGLRPGGRLAQLGAGLAPRLGFRLERLRLRAGDGPDATYACRLVTVEDEDLVVTAAVDPHSTFADWLGQAPLEGEGGARPVPARAARTGTASRVRFVWATGPDGRIAIVSPELATVVGGSQASVVGRRWDELRGRELAAGADRVAAAMEGGAAWTGVVVLWRTAEGSEAVPVELAGAPVRGRGATGYRGFGLCWANSRVSLPEEEQPDPDPPGELVADVEPEAILPVPRPVPADPDKSAPRPRLVLVSDASGAETVRSEAGRDPPPLSETERGALAEIARTLAAPPSGAPQTSTEERSTLAGETAPARPPAPPSPPQIVSADPRPADAEAAAAAVADALVWLDDAGRIRASHGAIDTLFGVGAQELVGADVAALLHPDDHRAALECLNGALGGGVTSAEVRGRSGPEGGTPFLMRAARPSANASGVVVAFLEVGRFKAAERRLQEARQAALLAKDDQIAFLARVSHEIRTPLNAIIGFAELMLGERFGPLGSDRYRDYLRDIRQSGSHVLSLVNDLLDLAKVTSGHADLTPAPVHLNAVLSSIVATLAPLALRERTILRTSLASNLPPVMVDERSLKQVALNVLSNAIRFSGAGGQAIVSTALGSTGDVILRVRDTGPGMSPAEIEAALTPFRQLATTRREDGTGLGLPLSKALVEANGGAFSLTSGRGSGTLVEIRLSATRPAQPDRAPQTPYSAGDPSSSPAPNIALPDPARDRPARSRSPAAAR